VYRRRLAYVDSLDEFAERDKFTLCHWEITISGLLGSDVVAVVVVVVVVVVVFPYPLLASWLKDLTAMKWYWTTFWTFLIVSGLIIILH
jgi:hypothetical protein